GAGTLILASDNSAFIGPITLDQNAGIVTITNVNALGSITAGTTVGTNSTLQLQNVTGNINEPLILNGPGVASNGALLNVSGNNTWAGSIVLGSPNPNGSSVNMGVAAGGMLTVSGVISDVVGAGPFSLTKVDAGKLIFNNANTYRGFTSVATGILNV